jgi:hypothetical protein
VLLGPLAVNTCFILLLYVLALLHFNPQNSLSLSPIEGGDTKEPLISKDGLGYGHLLGSPQEKLVQSQRETAIRIDPGNRLLLCVCMEEENKSITAKETDEAAVVVNRSTRRYTVRGAGMVTVRSEACMQICNAVEEEVGAEALRQAEAEPRMHALLLSCWTGLV